MVELVKWQNFYVIVGSAGAALIGVQFVVVTLIASLRKNATADALHAFGTPNVVHFGTALVLSAVMCAPWPSIRALSIAHGLMGLCGIGYGVIVLHRARRQTDYKPGWDDWIWYAALPSSLYAAVTLAAFLLQATTDVAPFMIGGAALGFLLIGIRNAWDSVTHIVVARPGGDTSQEG